MHNHDSNNFLCRPRVERQATKPENGTYYDQSPSTDRSLLPRLPRVAYKHYLSTVVPRSQTLPTNRPRVSNRRPLFPHTRELSSPVPAHYRSLPAVAAHQSALVHSCPLTTGHFPPTPLVGEQLPHLSFFSAVP